jgi:hypothetical protein
MRRHFALANAKLSGSVDWRFDESSILSEKDFKHN